MSWMILFVVVVSCYAVSKLENVENRLSDIEDDETEDSY